MHFALDHRAEPDPAFVPPSLRLAEPSDAPSGERRNRYARWALHERLGEGDVVALLMRNQPDVLAIWQGLGSVGVTVMPLDLTLRGTALARSLDAIGPRHLFVDAGLAETLCSVQGLVSVQPLVWWHGGADFARIDLEIAEYDDAPLDPRDAAAPRA